MARLKILDPDILPSDVHQLAVLETRAPRNPFEEAAAIARTLEMKGEGRSEAGMHVLADGAKNLIVYEETGAFWYFDSDKLGNEDYNAELPSLEEAKKRASEYLAETGWLPDQFAPEGVLEVEREIIRGDKDGERFNEKDHICVNFRARFGEIEAYGPGAKIKVFVGHKGEIIGLFRAAPDVTKYAEFPLLPLSEVEEVLERNLGQSLKRLKLVTAKLIYHTESCVNARRFVQPAYLLEFETEARSKRGDEEIPVQFELRPFPATRFAPIVTIESSRPTLTIDRGEKLELRCRIKGGAEPYDIRWASDFDDELGAGMNLGVKDLSIAHRGGRVLPHTVTVTVTDRNGITDTDMLLVHVRPEDDDHDLPKREIDDDEDPYIGVEWCNAYGSGGLPHISGTDDSAKGFKDGIRLLPSWSSRFDWGNSAAWEQDFKRAGAPGGGTDSYWADNIHFAFFAGHGSSGRFWFGSTVDDHEMRAQDARWGDGHLNWIVLHACQTMRSNFEWDTWCDAFSGLHQMFGFHTNTQGSTPPLGARFALWSHFKPFPWMDTFPLRTAWRIACQECFDASREYSMIYANQSGTDTANDHLPGYGYVSPDPTAPTSWVYTKDTC